MKRGPDLDIEALLTDLGNDPTSPSAGRSDRGGDIESDVDDSYDSWDDDTDSLDGDEYRRDDEYSDR